MLEVLKEIANQGPYSMKNKTKRNKHVLDLRTGPKVGIL